MYSLQTRVEKEAQSLFSVKYDHNEGKLENRCPSNCLLYLVLASMCK